MTGRAESRASQVRRAEKTLLALLRTPKTRPGLIAAVTGKGISKRFVFGWLSVKLRDGVVVPLKSSYPLTYQLASTMSTETPSEGVFPSWLEPRVLPISVGRTAYLDGRRVVLANPSQKPPK